MCPSDEGFQWYATSGEGGSAGCPPSAAESSAKSQEEDESGTE